MEKPDLNFVAAIYVKINLGKTTNSGQPNANDNFSYTVKIF